MRRSKPASPSPGSVAALVLMPRLSCPTSIFHTVFRPHCRPSPQNSAVRCAAKSTHGLGRISKRMPMKYGRLTSRRLPSAWPASAVKRHGPTQRRMRHSGASDSARSSISAGSGRALLERMRLPCCPGPHQRSSAFTPSSQLPARSVSSEPSKRSAWRSAGSVTPATTSVVDQRAPPNAAARVAVPSSRPAVSKSRSNPG